MLITLVHSLFFIHHISVSYVLATLKFGENLDENLRISRDFPHGFLTIWNFFLQTVYLGLVILLDLKRSANLKIESKKFQVLKKVRGYLLTGILGPFSIFVPTVFWFVYFVNRELIYPKIIDTVVPYYVNVAVHAVIMLVVGFEIFIGQEFIPKKRYSLTLLWVYQLMYLIALITINHIYGIWVYGYLRALGSLYRNIFFIGALLSTNLFYFICYNLQLNYKKLNNIQDNHDYCLINNNNTGHTAKQKNNININNNNNNNNNKLNHKKTSNINKLNNFKKRC